MPDLLIISGAPSPTAPTGLVVSHMSALFEAAGHHVTLLNVRALPTLSLLNGDLRDPEIAAAVSGVLAADGLVVASPVYRAAYSGLVKTLLDLLPKKALRGRAVLPLATGGSQGYLVAMDYALHPLLAAKGADQVVRGEFVLDQNVGSAASSAALDAAADRFTQALTPRLRKVS